ncbi:MAG TPA: hypothetical protein VMU77_02805 [Acidimicrobiales bacterium]|nr:hypothetical protein [Acidimicrobiales bacterium]
MWSRSIFGLIFIAVGAIWFTQGIGVLKGSFMTGDTTWVVIGIGTFAVGIGLLVWAFKVWRDYGN